MVKVTNLPNVKRSTKTGTLRKRGWCLTLNNYTEEEYTRVVTFCNEKDMRVTYAVIGRECGASGTPHLQIYMHFKQPVSQRFMKLSFPKAHLEVAKGTPEQNRVYCSKENNFVEIGAKPLIAADGDVARLALCAKKWAAAKAGRFEELPPEHIQKYEYIHMKYGRKPAIRPHLKNLWIHGRSGVGKSRWTFERFPGHYKKPASKWWDGYNGEQVVVFQDYQPSFSKYLDYFLKIWADHYPFIGEVKGGSALMRPEIVIFTSQYTLKQCFHPDFCGQGVSNWELWDAMSRRFEVKDFDTSSTWESFNWPPQTDGGGVAECDSRNSGDSGGVTCSSADVDRARNGSGETRNEADSDGDATVGGDEESLEDLGA